MRYNKTLFEEIKIKRNQNRSDNRIQWPSRRSSWKFELKQVKAGLKPSGYHLFLNSNTQDFNWFLLHCTPWQNKNVVMIEKFLSQCTHRDRRSKSKTASSSCPRIYMSSAGLSYLHFPFSFMHVTSIFPERACGLYFHDFAFWGTYGRRSALFNGRFQY